ncbi:MAG TPA: response regulator transcription factor [Solirubrobacteraceae bacterium]|nr:response regulator transcription factor [Solirubrobacteraceae bacterium]
MTLRCVIVDDSRVVLDAARELLESQGIAVVGVATTGDEALSVVEDLDPDVMLVDIVLGAESGFDLASRLAQSSAPARSRIILISTHDEADFEHLIGVSPAIGFLPKSDLSAPAIHRLLARAPDEGDAEPRGR